LRLRDALRFARGRLRRPPSRARLGGLCGLCVQTVVFFVFFVGCWAFDQLRVFVVAFRDLNPRYCAELVAQW